MKIKEIQDMTQYNRRDMKNEIVLKPTTRKRLLRRAGDIESCISAVVGK